MGLTITVTATRMRVRELIVVHPGGRQLVIGGRLISDVRGESRITYPDLPAYKPTRFPCNEEDWILGSDPEVKVYVRRTCGFVPCGRVHAAVLLFTALPVEECRAYLDTRRKP